MMSILKSSRTSSDVSLAAVMPVPVMLFVVAFLFGDRLGGVVSVVLVVAGLGVLAWAGAVTRAKAGERARRDEAVLDALEPLAGLRR
ncbi:hypothetical protein VR44_04595 [Streptomyces katrae]|uniref:Uncharacterized protein n=1 Tax=Streptomyces katrae TaxID=68223 RepID=A0A0F4JVV0_9ACTN|nr:hypothetical protein VR44_04595 [Streptomyces katrae]